MPVTGFPLRLGRGSWFASIDRPNASDAPVHAAYWRFDGDHSAGAKTRCGRVLYAPVEFDNETGVTCSQCASAPGD